MASVAGLCVTAMKSVLRLPLSCSGRLYANRVSWRSLATGAEASNKASADDSEKPVSSSAAKEADAQSADVEKKKLQEQIAELQDKYKRSLAETENVRQRLKKQIDDAKLFGVQSFCKDLLEVADILARATESIPKDNIKQLNVENAIQSLTLMHEGLRLTESQLLKVFERHGLAKISPATGEKFDPNFHEALFQQPASEDKQRGTVAVVSKIGYKLHNRTLRPALVGVFG